MKNNNLSGPAVSFCETGADISLMDDCGVSETLSLEEHNRLLKVENDELREKVLQLETSRAMYYDLYDFSPAGYLTLNEEGIITEANLTAAALLGIERQYLINCNLNHYIHPEDSAGFYSYFKRIVETGSRQEWELRLSNPDGTTPWVRFEANTVWEGEYRVIISDINAHKQVEQELTEANELFSMFMRYSPVYTYIKEVTCHGSRVLRASDNFVQITGMSGSEMCGKQMDELFPAEFAEKINQEDHKVVSSGQLLKVEEIFNGRNYTTIKFPVYIGDRILLAGYTIDTTDRCKAEEERLHLERQLMYMHKMDSLGRMSAGVAHDFNNLLQAVLGNLELALMKIDDQERIRKHVSRAVQAAEDAARLSGLMLAYSGKSRTLIKELDLSELVDGNAALLSASISNSITLDFQLDRALPPVKVDAGLIQQVLMSLVANSSEAIGAGNGLITISTGVSWFDRVVPDRSRLEEKPPAGRYVWMEVRDNGCGMDDETIFKLFDPFFTTKFTGRGLSMSATHGIIRAHGGAILVDSTPNAGTCIRILFPIAGQKQE
ncbi:MAG: hypothetical protein A2X82_02305 [Geobacteraceae bacterium GWC2_55_20]|nr:MAG: hypothetical protein A2X82_02305 [Geobacteraceae bacterium GWC2_55_20]OGU26731.1 MAG: hypothetical protein A2X85_04775 [Geobacteraceae bacterium GWF2_54_21]